MAKSNNSILEHILSYCNEIQTTMLRFGDNLDTFINDIDYSPHKSSSYCADLSAFFRLESLLENFLMNTDKVLLKCPGDKFVG